MARKQYFQYDRLTGMHKATIISDSPPQAFYQLELDEDAVTAGMMVDLSQDPPVLVPIPEVAAARPGKSSPAMKKASRLPKKVKGKTGRASSSARKATGKKTKR
jgi:hypothetical protein